MITFKINEHITMEEAIGIYEKSGLPRLKDLRVVQNMLANANVILTAWENDTLVGFRSNA